MGSDILESALIGAAIGVAVVVVMALIGMTRKPNFAAPPRRANTVRSSLPPAEAMTKIMGLAGLGKLQLAKEEPEKNLIVFSDSMSIWSFGVFYPIFVREGSDGGSEISVGISPKAPQYGPVITNKLRRMTETVQAAVSADS